MTYTIPKKICVKCSDLGSFDITSLFLVCICEKCYTQLLKGKDNEKVSMFVCDCDDILGV